MLKGGIEPPLFKFQSNALPLSYSSVDCYFTTHKLYIISDVLFINMKLFGKMSNPTKILVENIKNPNNNGKIDFQHNCIN